MFIKASIYLRDDGRLQYNGGLVVQDETLDDNVTPKVAALNRAHKAIEEAIKELNDLFEEEGVTEILVTREPEKRYDEIGNLIFSV